MTVTLPDQISPCPFCGAEMTMRERSSFHPTNQCWLTNMELDDFEYTAWNNRAAISSALTATGGPVGQIVEVGGSREALQVTIDFGSQSAAAVLGGTVQFGDRVRMIAAAPEPTGVTPEGEQ